jgi:uncharacterized metal-binding protein YceD (DUF177 family)
MPLLVNLRNLEADNVVLDGEMPVEELDIDTQDELLRLGPPLRYKIEVQKVEDGLLVQGELHLPLECHCARCLKAFAHPLDLPHWTRLVLLEGEEAAPVENDCIDLTPLVREDILLEFPQHPLCEAECGGLPAMKPGAAESTSNRAGKDAGGTAWDELSKLKFKE